MGVALAPSRKRSMLIWTRGACRRKLEPAQPETADEPDEPEPEEVPEDLDLGLEPWVDWIVRVIGNVVEQL